ncbi:12201_t:CDS:2, partial [Funneliformis geosporum]
MVKTKELNAEQYGAILYGHKRETGSAIPKKRCGPKPLFNSNTQSSLKKIVIQNLKH